jgi:hypothetical protein
VILGEIDHHGDNAVADRSGITAWRQCQSCDGTTDLSTCPNAVPLVDDRTCDRCFEHRTGGRDRCRDNAATMPRQTALGAAAAAR